MTKTFINGRVLTNDGDTALVKFHDGMDKFYTRDVESKEAFTQMFPMGSSIQVEKIPFEVTTREDLFALFEKCLGKPDNDGVAVVTTSEERGEVVIGVVQRHGCIDVFCSESMCHPAGADVKGFALFDQQQRSQWYATSAVDIEDALVVAAETIMEERHANEAHR